MKKKLIIGICGGSCTGKTTIANALCQKLGAESVTISFDDYYERPKHLIGKKIIDWEDLDLYRLDKFTLDLKNLKDGKKIIINSKSRESHLAGIKEKIIKPTSIIFVEGFIIFHDKNTRKLFDKNIYIDLSEEKIIKRRLARPEVNGSDNDLKYLKKYLIPAHRKYVFPQKEFADLILDGNDNIEVNINKICAWIKKK